MGPLNPALDSILQQFWNGTAATVVLAVLVIIVAWVVWTQGFNRE